jgi:hypothetical protein
MKFTVKEFAQEIRKLFPRDYDDLSDDELVTLWLKKYPEDAKKLDPNTLTPNTDSKGSNKFTAEEFAQEIRKLFPGDYDDLSDDELLKLWLKKYPKDIKKVELISPSASGINLPPKKVNQKVKSKLPPSSTIYQEPIEAKKKQPIILILIIIAIVIGGISFLMNKNSSTKPYQPGNTPTCDDVKTALLNFIDNRGPEIIELGFQKDLSYLQTRNDSILYLINIISSIQNLGQLEYYQNQLKYYCPETYSEYENERNIYILNLIIKYYLK